MAPGDGRADDRDAEQSRDACDRVVDPLAMPASRSLASASTVAVSGATIIVSPNEKTIRIGKSSVQ